MNTSFHFFRWSSPATFYPLAGRCIPIFWALTLLTACWGLALSFFIAPVDFQQGQGYRIIFVHVPASWLSMFIYLVMAFWAAIGLVFHVRLASIVAQALAPTGALMAFLSLWTGAFWGKPMWGTYWVWDARLTSQLLLLFLYMGFMALHSSIDEVKKADKASAILALVGSVNIPIIYFSVQWWNTLHQGASVSLTKAPSMATSMLWGMLVMSFCFWFYTWAVTLMRTRTLIIQREPLAQWLVPFLTATKRKTP